MLLLVSVRHVGAHPGEHHHGVSIQISISLDKTFLRISRIRNIPLTWILARVFVYVPPFISQILDFIYWTVLILILIYFEWRDTENQQYMEGRATFKVGSAQAPSTLNPSFLTPCSWAKHVQHVCSLGQMRWKLTRQGPFIRENTCRVPTVFLIRIEPNFP